MEATSRQLRVITQRVPSTPEFPATERQRKRHENIVDCGRATIAEFGLRDIRVARFATAMRMALCTLRRHFTDLDELLGEICRRHLQAIAIALGAIDPESPDPARARRAAYIALTRGPHGGLTEDQILLTRDSLLLPADERHSIEATRRALATNLAGPNCDCPDKVLALLDDPALDLAEIEFLVANLAPPLTAAQLEEAHAIRQASTSIASIPWQLPEGPPGHPNRIYSPNDPPTPRQAPEPIHNTA
jgi:AcrR family transcriptional regulator